MQIDSNRLSRAFQKHPAIKVLSSTPVKLSKGLGPQDLADLVVQLEDVLIKSGVAATHADIRSIAVTHGQNSEVRTSLRHFSALLSIRDSLRNINQLIYQAAISDRLSVLNEDNVIKIERHGHTAGTGVVAQVQTGKALGYVDLGDLVLLKVPGISLEQLGRIERMHYTTSAELGEDVELQLREVDDDLNAFGGLLANI